MKTFFQKCVFVSIGEWYSNLLRKGCNVNIWSATWNEQDTKESQGYFAIHQSGKH